jgi:hypothetical protein
MSVRKTETREEYNARMNAYMKKRYKKTQEWYYAYKVEKGCADCGWNKHHAGLQADHLISRKGDDTKTIARMMVRGLGVLKRELEFCEIVCGACHGIRTWNRLQDGKRLQSSIPSDI